MDLNTVREKIAECDLTIIELIAERNKLAAEVGKIKMINDTPVCIPSVEIKVKERYITEGTARGISEKTLGTIASTLIEESKRVQTDIINNENNH